MPGWDKKGIIFIAIITLIAILALVGTVGVLTTTTEVKISSNYKTNAQALYVAQTGELVSSFTLSFTLLEKSIEERVESSYRKNSLLKYVPGWRTGLFGRLFKRD